MQKKGDVPSWVLYLIITTIMVILIVVVIRFFIRPAWESVSCEGKLSSALSNLWSTAANLKRGYNIATFYVPSCVHTLTLCDGSDKTKYRVVFSYDKSQTKVMETAYDVWFIPCDKVLTPATPFYTVKITYMQVEVISESE